MTTRVKRVIPRLIERDMVWQDDRAGLADTHSTARINATFRQHIEFFEQCAGRQHHTVTDQTADILTQDAGRDQMQDGLFTLDNQGVTSIVATLKAHHRVGLVGQQIDNLAFALIAPLGANDNYVLAHRKFSSRLEAREGRRPSSPPVSVICARNPPLRGHRADPAILE